jgi:hypothetical protein
MEAPLLSLIGLLLGLVGSGVLAYGLDQLLRMLKTSVDALDMTVQQVALGAREVVVMGGLDKHRESALRSAAIRTRVGFWMLIVGFALQAYGTILAI